MMRKIILAMLCLIVLSAPAVHAAPQPLDDAQIEQIRRNCGASQSYLQQIQRNDAAARINRGRVYESMTKLVANFNSRVALNRLDAPTLVAAAGGFSGRVSDFQADYLAYEDAISATLKINCREQPVTFYDTLTGARDLRAKVAKDIQDIDAQLEAYQKGITDLRTAITPAPAQGVQP